MRFLITLPILILLRIEHELTMRIAMGRGRRR